MNNNVYSNNMAALKKRYKKIYDFLMSGCSDDYDIEESKALNADTTYVEDRKVLYAEKDGAIYQLDSMYQSDKIYEIWFSGLKDNWGLDAKCCMYGLGSGEFARKFLEFARNDCTICVHEPSLKIFRTVIENYDICDLLNDNRFKLILWPAFHDDSFKNYYFNHVLNYTDLATMAAAIHINYPRLFPDDLQIYAEEIKNVREFIIANQTVQERFGHNYNENSFNNFKYFKNSKSLESIKRNIRHDLPAVIVSAGPSLDKNIKELKKAEGKAFIIATDTALRPLAKAGITPDIGISLDGKKDAKYLSEMESREIPLICSIRAGKDFMNLHSGSKFFIYDYSEHLNQFCKGQNVKLADIATGGSVANGAFAMAVYLGFTTIILVGQDLAYTGDKTHSAVTVRGEVYTAVEDLENVVWAEDINGNKVRSSGEFKIYKEWFEQKIRENPQVKVYDATEGGVKIEGTEIITLKAVIEKECINQTDYKTAIDGAKPFLDSEGKAAFQKFIDEIPEKLNKMRILAEKSYSNYVKMIRIAKNGNYRSTEFKHLYEENTRIAADMNKMEVMEYVVNQLQEKTTEILNHVNELRSNEQEEIIASCELGKKHIENIIEAIKELKEYL